MFNSFYIRKRLDQANFLISSSYELKSHNFKKKSFFCFLELLNNLTKKPKITMKETIFEEGAIFPTISSSERKRRRSRSNSSILSRTLTSPSSSDGISRSPSPNNLPLDTSDEIDIGNFN